MSSSVRGLEGDSAGVSQLIERFRRQNVVWATHFAPAADLFNHVSMYSQAQLNKVARQLNERPRKTLGFETPAQRFNACVASIAEPATPKADIAPR